MIPFCIFNNANVNILICFYCLNKELIEISAANLWESSYVVGILITFSCVVKTSISSSHCLEIVVALTYVRSGGSVTAFRCSDRVLC